MTISFLKLNMIIRICDLATEETRGTALGLTMGASIGLGLALGLPLGIVLSAMGGPDFSFYAAFLISIFAAFFVLFLPVGDIKSSLLKRRKYSQESAYSDVAVRENVFVGDKINAPYVGEDTKELYETSAADGDSWFHRNFVENRVWPKNPQRFLVAHNPFSGMEIIRKAKHTSSWWCYYLSITAQTVIQLVFVEYFVEVFDWSVSAAGVVVTLLGVSIAFFSPCMSSRYLDLQLYPLGAFCCAIGSFLISMAGTMLALNLRLAFGVCGLFFLAFGGFFFPSIQSLVTCQYAPDLQGEVTGVMGQLNQMTNIFAYPISLLFPIMISSDAPFYWPGIPFT